jgi:proteasome assembly chaperone (PAC2) family protein
MSKQLYSCPSYISSREQDVRAICQCEKLEMLMSAMAEREKEIERVAALIALVTKTQHCKEKFRPNEARPRN